MSFNSLKKTIKYRVSYSGTKETDILYKRYFINQRSSDRTKHITKKENIRFTIDCFSDFFSIVLSALARR